MPLENITDITAPTISIASPNPENFEINFTPVDLNADLTTAQQIDTSLTGLRNSLNNYLAEAKRLQEIALNENNLALVNDINAKINALEVILAGWDQDQINKSNNFLNILNKVADTDLDTLATIDFLIDGFNAEYVRDSLGADLTVSTLTEDGENGNYFEITYPIVTKSGKSIASIAEINVNALNAKSVVIDAVTNPFVEVTKVVKNETTGIRIYVQSKGVHLRPFPYKTDATAWNSGGVQYSKPFTVNLDFERIKSGSEIKSFVVPVLTDGSSDATTDQTVGAGN